MKSLPPAGRPTGVDSPGEKSIAQQPAGDERTTSPDHAAGAEQTTPPGHASGDDRTSPQPPGDGASPADLDGDDDLPPFGRSWRVLYAIVLLNLALLILLFYAFTRAFS